MMFAWDTSVLSQSPFGRAWPWKVRNMRSRAQAYVIAPSAGVGPCRSVLLEGGDRPGRVEGGPLTGLRHGSTDEVRIGYVPAAGKTAPNADYVRVADEAAAQ